MDKEQEKKPRVKPIIEAADSLSLGISIVVAIFLGIGIGVVLKNITGVFWTLWVGVAIGIAAAILNVYKAYSKQYKEYEALARKRQEKIDAALDDEDEEDFSGTKY